MIAARVAADLSRDSNVAVEMVKGGLGELRVDVNEQRVFTGNRLLYPTPGSVIKKVRAALV